MTFKLCAAVCIAGFMLAALNALWW